MGKKSRSKKKKQEKQRHVPVDDKNPTNTSISTGLDITRLSLNDDVSHQIVTPFFYIWKHDQERDFDHVNTQKSSANCNMDPNDFVSHLPDNILHHISSLLPFESAVQTCFLSTHWKHLWREALLDLVHDVNTMEAAIKVIQSFLDGFDLNHPPRNKWGFIFEFNPGRAVLVACVSRNGALQLDFSAGKQLPRPFDLLLEWEMNTAWPNYYSHRYGCRWCPEENHPWLTKQPSLNTMTVKSLYLISVSHLSNMTVSSLVPNLPFLKSLTISKCNGLQSLEIKEAKSLRKLVVLDCAHLQSLSFYGSCLKSFRYRGNLVSFRFRGSGSCYYVGLCAMYNRPLFSEDIMVDLRKGPLTQWSWNVPLFTPYYHCQVKERKRCSCADNYKCFNSFLRSINMVESLTICRWFYEMSVCEMLPSSSEYPGYCLSELQELWWIDCSIERESINALLCFLKLFPYLERLYVTIDPKCYKLPSTEKFSALVIVPDKLKNLEAVKLEGFADEGKEILMARRLIPLFGEKNPVIISKSHGKCLKHLVKVTNLEKRGKYPYKFKVVENVDEKLPDHVHMNI